MASKTLMFLVISILSLLQLQSSAAQNVVRAAYWFPESGFAASDIDSTLFTHLFCAFADIDPRTNQVIVPAANNALFASFTRTVQLKNPSIRTLLSIGGGNASRSAAFASMASQSTSRRAFIDSSIRLARSYGFSGLDLDWEYPRVASDMTNLGTLLNEWRAVLATEATTSGRPRLYLTAAVSVSPDVDGVLRYPTQSISTNLDWINVMAYDFYAPPWSGTRTNAPAALNDPTGEVSGSIGIGAWIEVGVNVKKLVLGLPFYGYAWRLVNSNNHGLLAPANGGAGSGDSSMVYSQIRAFISQNRATTVYDSTIVSDYCYSGTTWIGYDDLQSISTKVAFARQRGLLGYFAWHVGGDNNWALSQRARQAWGAQVNMRKGNLWKIISTMEYA